MRRDLSKLTNQKFDVLVIGGGITGANIAWDAALRGLSVALLEKADFGSATSANSLKTIHGGLRYLQDGSLSLVRTMIKERQAFLRIAPHLVQPLPVIMPTMNRKLMRSKFVLGSAVKANDLVAFDRNFNIDRSRELPNSRLLSRNETLNLLPGLNGKDVSGAVLWYDAQVYNTERLLLSFVLSAAELGAQAANYVGVIGFLREECRIIGVKAADKLSGNDIQVQAKVVVNAAGPWVDELLADLDGSISKSHFIPSTAINLVTRKIIPDFAAGLTSHYTQVQKNGSIGQSSRVLFIAPWRDYSLVGTLHEPHNGNPNESGVTEKLINSFIEEVNQAYPGAKLSRNDVFQIHHGFLPMIPDRSETAKVKLVREGKLIDHEKEEGIEGLITTVGVKYTTARHLAEKTVDLVFTKLKRPTPKCQTRFHPVSGGNIHHFGSYVTETRKHWPVEMPAYQIERLLHTYGTNHSQLFPYYLEGWDWMQPFVKESNVTRAELIHAVRSEMAQKLSDVIFRRTEIGMVAKQSKACLLACAQLVGTELAWSGEQIEQEIEEVTGVFANLHNY